MLIRIVSHSFLRHRRRKLLSLAAVALGITVATAVGTIALDVGDKVSRELRSFGANIAVMPVADCLPVVVGGVDYRPAGAGSFLQEPDLARIKKIFWRNNITALAPFLYLPARVETSSPRSAAAPVVLVGAWFDHALVVSKTETFKTGLRQLHTDWRVIGAWPAETVEPAERVEGAEPGEPAKTNAHGCLVGRRLAQRLGVSAGETLKVAPPAAAVVKDYTQAQDQRENAAFLERHTETAPPPVDFKVTGILDSGGLEDDQILAPLVK